MPDGMPDRMPDRTSDRVPDRMPDRMSDKKVRKNVRQVCDILLANLQVCGSVIGAMPLLTLRVAKFEAISLNR